VKSGPKSRHLARHTRLLVSDLPLFRPDISPVGADRASVMRCRWSLLPAVGCCCCCHRCCQPRSGKRPAAPDPAPSSVPRRTPFPPCDHRDGLAHSSPPTRLLPNPGTDGFCQGRLRVYLNRAPLTGSGCPSVTDGLDRFRESQILLRWVGGRPLHFHPHTSGRKPNLTIPHHKLGKWTDYGR